MSKDSGTPPPGGQFLVYQTENEKLKIDVAVRGRDRVAHAAAHGGAFPDDQAEHRAASKMHFCRGRTDSVVKESFTTAADGKNYATRFYNLDAIISVGYRVKSAAATRFRI